MKLFHLKISSGSSKNVTTDKLCAYLGCCIILSVNPAEKLKHAFSSDPYMYNHGIRSIFTLRRFTKIGQYLCIYYKQNELPRNSPHYDRRFKFQKLVNTEFVVQYTFYFRFLISHITIKVTIILSVNPAEKLKHALLLTLTCIIME